MSSEANEHSSWDDPEAEPNSDRDDAATDAKKNSFSSRSVRLKSFVPYSLTECFNEKRMFRARPSEHYDIFWEMIKETAYSLPWLIRKREEKELEPPFTKYDFKYKLSPATIWNFVRRHRRRMNWEEKNENCLELRRCKYLPNSRSQYRCGQRQICPFCLCARSAVPLYETLCERIEAIELREPRLCRITFFAKDDINGPECVERLTPLILKLRQKIRDTKLFRNTPDKWFRPCLAGPDTPHLQVALHCLFMVDKADMQQMFQRLEDLAKSMGFLISKPRSYDVSPKSIIRQVGWFYQYPKWLLVTPLADIERYLNTSLFNSRVKR